MDGERQHLVLYDGTCGMCHDTVQFLLKNDKKKMFLFSPLQGETAELELKVWRLANPDADSVVLIENYGNGKPKHIYAYGKAAFKICWLLGGVWAILGMLSFLPSFLYDWGYRWVAKHRFEYFEKQSCLLPTVRDSKRFLP